MFLVDKSGSMLGCDRLSVASKAIDGELEGQPADIGATVGDEVLDGGLTVGWLG